ncbi:MAG: 1,4-alpha-glucan branching enzyme [Spirochaetes bacterium GWF1_31_7]|nr:MAG: 1,4-alpha-glucan branching enzyme [Spirochaetes bacterium GWE1_32_154]OHD46629.1 MAG: 1,4-alpha-glucan branching enzyme [Spirochaetes bacterium GWE2_31_10]OHD47643.1 MAG: 1,4-alpha-glucan branching enzyme [Spirochaetes bacterium GWF1_31_7]OHD74169.1 MAG: 1,4-alpha-glucan branching enzyme [Spirochaetes bacterium RIFOXYB1_FULL_32_8]HBD94420.1 1,4-alpha-glucan branching enzyme [Spirochaetia bacterium]
MGYKLKNDDIHKIINAEHHDPFTVLGYHCDEKNNKAVVRAFLPEAIKVELITDSGITLLMNKVHNDGLYEGEITPLKDIKYKFKLYNSENHSWILHDTYMFLPVLSDFDLHLFSEGNHFDSYNKLGAHCITLQGVKGVSFAVWAPNAKRVSVIGNFNHWDGRHNQMRVRGTSGIWELFIPDLSEGEIYKYEVKNQNNSLTEKFDPYGFRSELRPKTASVVHDYSTYKWKDKDYMKERDSGHNLNKPVSIYEIHPASWKRKNGNDYLTYKDLVDELIPYVVYMGYTHIELMGIAEHPFDGSWGYQVTGYYAPTSRHGTPNEFAYFVDQCHKNNIGVIMDWVPAHFPTDEFGLARFDGTALYEHEDPRKGFHKDWTTFIFNYGRNEVRNFLISNALYWVDVYHIDGLRVDAVASMLYLDYAREAGEWVPNEYGGNENLDAVFFIKTLNEKVYSKHPGVYMIAEESTAWSGVSRPTYCGGLGFGLKWNMGWMNDFLKYIEKNPIYRKYHHNDLTFSMIYAFNENFTLVISHDEVVHGKGSLINKMPGDDWQKFANLRCAMTYMYAHPGKKLLFMGSEFGQWQEWNYQQSLDWHLLDWNKHKELLWFFKELNKVYKENPALYQKDFSQDGFQWVNCNDWESSVLSFLRKSDDETETLLIVANFTPTLRHEYRVGVPKHSHWDEIFNSDATEFGGSGNGNCGGFWSDERAWDNQPYSINLTLPPLGVIILKSKSK